MIAQLRNLSKTLLEPEHLPLGTKLSFCGLGVWVLGGSLDNTLVLSETGLMNENGFRFHDECVRHKVLDLIGDLSLLGIPVIGHFVAHRAGHSVHAQMVKAILENPEAWILLNSSDEDRSMMVSCGLFAPQVHVRNPSTGLPLLNFTRFTFATSGSHRLALGSFERHVSVEARLPAHLYSCSLPVAFI